MRGFALAVSAAAFGVAASAAAQVFKCADDRGGLVYQDAPCPSGRELRSFAADPPAVSVIPMHPAAGTTTRMIAPPTARAKPPPAERKVKARAGDAADRRHIRPGMHEGEVLARIGTPDMKSGGGSRKLARWTYLPDPGDPQTLTTVVFDTGRVVEVERKVMR